MAEVSITVKPSVLAAAADCTAQYASQMLAGRRSPSRERALMIEAKLGIPASVWPLPEQPKKFEWSAERRAKQQDRAA
jgi:transcriptional regulator with XRE-family HTH domain